MCNVSKEVRATILYAVGQYVGEATGSIMTRTRIEESDAVMAWLDSLPAAPEPDWSLFDNDYDDDGTYDGPDCFIMDPHGNHAYYFRADEVQWHGAFPSLDGVIDSAHEWHMGWIVRLSEYNVGIDWRTTLRKRPTDGDSG